MLVSIITPMYNSEATIAETIKSVLAQTYSEWEMVIVDDCSTDASASIVKKYQNIDKRIHYYKREKKSSVANARNYAIKRSKGHYLAFLDSDDLWEKDKLQKQVSFMEKNNVSFCYSACATIDENSRKTGKIRWIKSYADYAILLKGNFIPCLTVVLEKKLFDKIEFPEIKHEDYAVWLSILKTGIKAYGINEVLAYYRVNSKSVSANKFKAALWTWDIYYNYEKIPFYKSAYYFINYFINAIRKRL